MKKLVFICAIALMSGCASTPFTFEGENANKGFAVISVGTSEACSNEFINSRTGMKGINVKAGRALTLSNVWVTSDFEENDTLLYAFPLLEGNYEINSLTYQAMTFPIATFDTVAVEPQLLFVKANEVQYLGNFILDSKDEDCGNEGLIFVKKDRKQRDMKEASKDHPHLIKS